VKAAKGGRTGLLVLLLAGVDLRKEVVPEMLPGLLDEEGSAPPLDEAKGMAPCAGSG
jgi:hypothetical protein